MTSSKWHGASSPHCCTLLSSRRSPPSSTHKAPVAPKNPTSSSVTWASLICNKFLAVQSKPHFANLPPNRFCLRDRCFRIFFGRFYFKYTERGPKAKEIACLRRIWSSDPTFHHSTPPLF